MLELDLSIFPVLGTERLLLRELEARDAEALFALRSDPVTMQYIGRPLAASVVEADGFIGSLTESRARNEALTWAIALREDDLLIGTIGYWRMKKEHHSAEIGYMLAPAHWGKGLVPEALYRVVEHGFQAMGLHRVEAITEPANTGSRRVLEKCGFVKEGHLKESWYFNGVFSDSVIYSKLART